MFWTIAIVAVLGIALAAGKAGFGQSGKPVVTVECGNMSAASTIRKWTARGYTLKSDAVHTFGKHTLVFVKD